jgi:hypothetical protein
LKQRRPCRASVDWLTFIKGRLCFNKIVQPILERALTRIVQPEAERDGAGPFERRRRPRVKQDLEPIPKPGLGPSFFRCLSRFWDRLLVTKTNARRWVMQGVRGGQGRKQPAPDERRWLDGATFVVPAPRGLPPRAHDTVGRLRHVASQGSFIPRQNTPAFRTTLYHNQSLSIRLTPVLHHVHPARAHLPV